MICQACGTEMEKVRTDIPFKTGDTTIVVLKELPVYQCPNCREFLIDDSTMEQVDQILDSVDKSSELEIRRFAA